MTASPGQTRLRLRAPTTYDPRTRRDVSIVALHMRIADHVVNPQP
ncbi:hypothetical protein [Roseiflexus sp.]